MMGGMDGGRRLLERDVLKPKNLSATLARFGVYFRPYWLVMLGVLVLILAAAWTQVTLPDLTQAAVDCYLRPSSSCTYTTIPQNAPAGQVLPQVSTEERLAGLTGIVLKMLALFIGSSVLNGLAFFGMAWPGQHVLRQMRIDILTQGHRLSVSY